MVTEKHSIRKISFSHFINHQWVKVSGKLKWIASGKDIVVGVSANNDTFYRDGISDAAPTGT